MSYGCKGVMVDDGGYAAAGFGDGDGVVSDLMQESLFPDLDGVSVLSPTPGLVPCSAAYQTPRRHPTSSIPGSFSCVWPTPPG